LSEETAAADDVISQVLWRKVRAGLLARRGSFDDAERLATEAVRAVERTDMLDLSGDVLLTLADVLRLAGRPREAAPAAEQALAYYERKGNVVSAGRARRLLAELA
jgi:hypothetical protein